MKGTLAGERRLGQPPAAHFAADWPSGGGAPGGSELRERAVDQPPQADRVGEDDAYRGLGVARAAR